jgi:hypothetical protein
MAGTQYSVVASTITASTVIASLFILVTLPAVSSWS